MKPPTKIEHLGIAVESIAKASHLYRDVLGLECAGMEEIAHQKVKVAFYQIGEVRIELLEPTADDSPVRKFLNNNGPGLHHIAYGVADLDAALTHLKSAGVKLIDEAPRDGAHGMKIAFAHPKSTGGVLVEFCQRA